MHGFLTNRYNVLVGGVLVTQTRRAVVRCDADVDFLPPKANYECYASQFVAEAEHSMGWVVLPCVGKCTVWLARSELELH